MNVAKGIGIILVVIGHASTNINLLNFIYLFHMPLFFFISGYFYKDEHTKAPWEFFKKRVMGLYVPFIKFELLALVLHNIFLKWNIYTQQMTNGYSIRDMITVAQQIVSFQHTQIMTFTFWFLPSLFFASMIFIAINITANKLTKHSEITKAILVVGVASLGFVLTEYSVVLSWSLRTSMVAIPLFYCGYLFKRYESKVKHHFIIAGICLFVLFTNMDNRIDMGTDVYINPFFFYMNALLGVYLIIYASKVLSRKYEKLRFLNYCGRNTIIIMATQFLGLHFGRVFVSMIDSNVLNKLQVSGIVTSNTWIIVFLFGLFFPLAIQYGIDLVSSLRRNKTFVVPEVG